MKDLAPDIFRKRLLIEGFYQCQVDEEMIKSFFSHFTSSLGLRTYAEPIIHKTSGGADANQGYDAFVPLIDSGISLYVWTGRKFLSCVAFTCKEFDDRRAVDLLKTFFQMHELEHKLF